MYNTITCIHNTVVVSLYGSKDHEGGLQTVSMLPSLEQSRTVSQFSRIAVNCDTSLCDYHEARMLMLSYIQFSSSDIKR